MGLTVRMDAPNVIICGSPGPVLVDLAAKNRFIKTYNLLSSSFLKRSRSKKALVEVDPAEADEALGAR
jgi:hypothetical protein